MFIIAGESSGEIYGARLAEELMSRWPGLVLRGVGGTRMRQAGVDLVAGITSAIGLVEVIRSFAEIKRTFNKTIAALESQPPDVLVLIDYPDFNFRVARRARAMGIKILYYVTPQVWAWRKGRVRDMAGFVNRAAVILPFEEKHLRDAGIDAEFVGHPIAQEMEGVVPQKAEAKRALGLEAHRPYIGLLPGSRDSELTRLLPLMEGVVDTFGPLHTEYGFVLSVAPNIDAAKHSSAIESLREKGVVISNQDISSIYASCEAAVVASGTAAFQAVFTGTPIAVVYKVAPLTYFIMRRLVHLEFVNLANIILNRQCVKELIQSEAIPDAVCAELEDLVFNESRRVAVQGDMQKVSDMFKGRHPSERVAGMIGQMTGWSA